MNASETTPITRETPFEEFFPLFISTYLTEEKVNAYMAGHQPPVDYQTLIDFFHREPVKQLFKSYWDSERNRLHIPEHTMQTRIEQAVGQTLLLIARYGKTIFENEPMEQIRQTQKIAFFYEGYFNQEFHGKDSNIIP